MLMHLPERTRSMGDLNRRRQRTAAVAKAARAAIILPALYATVSKVLETGVFANLLYGFERLILPRSKEIWLQGH